MPLVLGLTIDTLSCLAQDLPSPEALANVASAKKKTPMFLNPPAISNHLGSNSLEFMLGTWIHRDNGTSIEEVWLKSESDNLTCVRTTFTPGKPEEKEVLGITNGSHGAGVSDFLFYAGMTGVNEHWAGSLDQTALDTILIKLTRMDDTLESQTVSYTKLSPKKVLVEIKRQNSEIRRWHLVKIK